MRRLYCKSLGGNHLCWATCATKADAIEALGEGAHLATDDDIRFIWNDLRLYEKSQKTLCELFGVSRQALDLWQQRVGQTIKKRSAFVREARAERIEAALKGVESGEAAWPVVRRARADFHVVKRIAKARGIELGRPARKRPSDEELVRLAEEKTWRELAEACGMSVSTLRNYVYAKKELAKAICPKMRSEPTGGPAHGKIDIEEMIRLYQQGEKAFRLAKKYGVSQSSVRYHLMKRGLLS